jgi:hypothetical protein
MGSNCTKSGWSCQMSELLENQSSGLSGKGKGKGDDVASPYVLHPLELFFISIYGGSEYNSDCRRRT